jgi:hypothetical protein
MPSHSGIGTATPIDYNLGNIQKNSVIIINVTVGISPVGEPAEQLPERELLTPVSHEEPAGSG